MKLSSAGAEMISGVLSELSEDSSFNDMTTPNLLQHLVERNIPVNVLYIDGHWLDIDSLGDLERGYIFGS